MESETNDDFLIAIGIIALLVISSITVYLSPVFDGYQSVLDFVYSLAWGKVFSIVKVLFILANFALLGAIIYTLWMYERLNAPGMSEAPAKETVTPKEEIRQNWEEIQRLASSQIASDWNMAILRADALIDDILRERRTEGTNLPDRLKTLGSGTIPSIDKVLSAHHLRNIIAHEPLEQHTRETIAQALAAYEQALRELNLLA